jgi:hypothetical protein
MGATKAEKQIGHCVRADDVLLTIDVVISFCFWRPLTQARSRYAFTSR